MAREIISKMKETAASAVNKKGQTALHMASAGGYISCVRLLSHYRKFANTPDVFGM